MEGGRHTRCQVQINVRLDVTTYVVKVALVNMRLSHSNAYPPHLMLVHRNTRAYGAPYGEDISKPMFSHSANQLPFSFRIGNI
jgi:hypothetical protein